MIPRNFWFKDFRPSSLSHLALWLEADRGIVKDVSNNITSWNDFSGFGRNATQSTNNPTWVNNKINGLPAVSFNGTNQWFNLACNHTDLYNSDKNQITMFAVILTVSTSQNQIISTSTATAGYIELFAPYSDGNCYWRTGNESSASISGAGNFNTNFGIIRALRNNGTSLITKNNSAIATSTTISAVSGNATPVFIGSFGGTQNFTNGFIAAIIIYNRTLITTEIQQVERYLSAKYAITLS